MSDTPRTDQCIFDASPGDFLGAHLEALTLARTLERELSESASKLERCSEQFDASERALEATTRKLEEAERANEIARMAGEVFNRELTEAKAKSNRLQQQLAEALEARNQEGKLRQGAEARYSEARQAAVDWHQTAIERAQQLAEARKDAERYRFLTNFEDWSRSGFSWHAIISKECLDEYIDVGLGLAFK